MALKHLRSSTANKRPQPSGVADGQLAINTASGSPGLFFKASNGTLVKVGPMHVGTTAPNAVPASGGASGNTIGEMWLDTSGSAHIFKAWDGTAWRSESELFVTRSGDTMTGSLTMGVGTTLAFEGSVDDGFETTLTVVNPTADRTITFPNITGTVITTGDTGTVTSAMIADGTIADADIGASAAIAHSKLANITAGRVLLGNASNVPTATAVTGDVTINSSGVTAISSAVIVDADVNTGAAIAGTKISPNFGSQNISTTGTATAASLNPTSSAVPTNGIYLPSANTIGIASSGVVRLTVDSSGTVNVPGALRQNNNNVVTVGDSGTVTSTMIADGTIVNADINASAAIADTKLATIATADKVSLSALNIDGATDIGAALTDVDLIPVDDGGAGTNRKAAVSRIADYVFTKVSGDIGITVSGVTSIATGAIVDADINASAAIAGTKISPNFGSQNLVTTGSSTCASFTPSSAAAPTTGVFLPAANTIGLSTSGIERVAFGPSGVVFNDGGNDYDFCIESDTDANIFFVDASTNRVGIGTAAPATTLTVNGDVTIADKIIHNGDVNTAIRFPALDTVSIETNGLERTRVDSSGRFLIGTASGVSTTLLGSAFLQVAGIDNQSSQLSISRFSANADTPRMNFIKSRGALGVNALVADGDSLGDIDWSGADGGGVTSYPLAAIIRCEVDGAPSANVMPGRLIFSVNPGTASGVPTEAARFNKAGELLVGYTTDNGAYKLQVNSQIFATSSIVATSDGRYKENVASLDGCLELVKALRPVSFAWKPQQDITFTNEDGSETLVREAHNFPDGTQVGFIAQEVQEVLTEKPWMSSIIKRNVRPAIVDNEENELAPEEEFLGIAEGSLVAVLTSALQEAISEIESLKTRLAEAGI